MSPLTKDGSSVNVVRSLGCVLCCRNVAGQTNRSVPLSALFEVGQRQGLRVLAETQTKPYMFGCVN